MANAEFYVYLGKRLLLHHDVVVMGLWGLVEAVIPQKVSNELQDLPS